MSPKKERELQESLEFLRGRFDELNQEIKRPHSLDADVLRYKLEHLDLIDEKPKRVYHWRALASVAACFVVVFGSIFMLKGNGNTAASLEGPMSSAAAFDRAEPAAGSAEASREASPDLPMPAAAPPAEEREAAPAPEAPPPAAEEAAPVPQEPPLPAPAAAPAEAFPEDQAPAENGSTDAGSAKRSAGSGSSAEDAAGEARPAPQEAPPAEDEVPDMARYRRSIQTEAAYAEDYTELRDTVFTLSGGMEAYAAANTPAANAAAMDGGDEAPAPVQSREMPAEMAAPNTAYAAPRGFSATNTQESGVDEADVVKTDGEYLYSYVYQNTTSKGPAIYIADADSMQLTATIELDGRSIEEFYITGDRLVTVGTGGGALTSDRMPKQTIVEATDDSLYQEITKRTGETAGAADAWETGRTAVAAAVYDISDRSRPTLVRDFLQDGSYTSSRMMDGVLYLVSERYVDPSFGRKNAPLSELVPVVYDGAKQTAEPLPANQIAIAPNARSASYAVVSALDIKSGRADTQAVLGGSDGVYMSEKNLYIYYESRRDALSSGTDSYQQTNIIRFGARGDTLRLRGTGRVNGSVYGQFAFSESGGNLRVAATADYPDGSSKNNLYVLGPAMEQVGALEGLAPGERIYSVRYLGKTAYLVTFRETDPLFAVDLSDPRNPKLLGQLKIPGFSQYLHPMDENTLIGIGQNANARGETGGLKLSMFDISDPLSPKELHVYNLGGQGSYSEALDNHRAVLFDGRRNLLAFPAYIVTGNGGSNAYEVFTCSRGDGFRLTGELSNTGKTQNSGFREINRGLYVGDTLYTFSPDLISSYNLDTMEPKDQLTLSAD